MPDDWFQDVLDFHVKLAPQIIRPLPYAHDTCDGLNDVDYSIGFIKEEAEELETAMAVGDIVEVADGLADLIYVAIRAALVFGIDLRPVFAEVHRTNMAKVGGPTRADSKICKPEGWQPPDIKGVLARQRPLTGGANA